MKTAPYKCHDFWKKTSEAACNQFLFWRCSLRLKLWKKKYTLLLGARYVYTKMTDNVLPHSLFRAVLFTVFSLWLKELPYLQHEGCEIHLKRTDRSYVLHILRKSCKFTLYTVVYVECQRVRIENQRYKLKHLDSVLLQIYALVRLPAKAAAPHRHQRCLWASQKGFLLHCITRCCCTLFWPSIFILEKKSMAGAECFLCMKMPSLPLHLHAVAVWSSSYERQLSPVNVLHRQKKKKSNRLGQTNHSICGHRFCVWLMYAP